MKWWLLIAIIAFLGLQLFLTDYLVDDAYIHLTFSRNIATGNGFSFNPGESEYGTSAPTWTLLLALFCKIFGASPVLTKLLSTLFGVLSIVSVYRLCQVIGLRGSLIGSVTLVWAVNVWLVRWSASGMESTMAVWFITLAVTTQIQKKSISGIWLSLAMLSRPESVMLLPVFMVDYFRECDWRKATVVLGLSLSLLVPWLIASKLIFGTIVPNTALVKSEVGLPALADFLYGTKRTILIIGSSHGIEVLICCIFAGLLISGRIPKKNSFDRKLVMLLIWAVFPTLFYLAKGVFVSSRYLLIGFPGLILATFYILNRIDRKGIGKITALLPRYIPVAIIVLHLFLTFRVTLPHAGSFEKSLNALARMAEIIRTETPNSSSVAVGDVGLIGFACDRYVVDLEGLVTREIIQYRVGHHLDSLIFSEGYFKVRQTDYILDKAKDSSRLKKLFGDRYKIIHIESIPGAMITNAKEKWYYTLYKILNDSKNPKG